MLTGPFSAAMNDRLAGAFAVVRAYDVPGLGHPLRGRARPAALEATLSLAWTAPSRRRFGRFRDGPPQGQRIRGIAVPLPPRSSRRTRPGARRQLRPPFEAKESTGHLRVRSGAPARARQDRPQTCLRGFREALFLGKRPHLGAGNGPVEQGSLPGLSRSRTCPLRHRNRARPEGHAPAGSPRS